MKNYIDIVQNVLDNGMYKKPVRVDEKGSVDTLDNDTIGLPNIIFSHDMQDGFPLLTTKKMPIKTIAVELEGFIHGITNKRWYEARKCKIWSEWSNPQVVDRLMAMGVTDSMMTFNDLSPEAQLEIRRALQKEEKDLGPIYGYQWRKFDEHYGGIKGMYETCDGTLVEGLNGVLEGTDQLQSIADKLRENPTDRRMVCSAWNPNQIKQMALPPCHFAWNVVVYGDTLNLIWHQRSCDLMLGVPFNIASYALLLSLLANHAGLKPGNLTGTLNDCHIYLNQVDAAREQVDRVPLELPGLELPSSQSIFDWTYEDVKIKGYNSFDKLDFGKVTI